MVNIESVKTHQKSKRKLYKHLSLIKKICFYLLNNIVIYYVCICVCITFTLHVINIQSITCQTFLS